ncbi:hypothetical protein A3F65_01750 [Candidatus Saccharibacteria bacterium RIFCSPHIGHO2_12_FULL_47_16b]|nr:MAG: hypothetical protein A3F65_01750 [Candidatus Saccharibacteria bacterium RIFCSPHIGHO2_12_FULL_47_16b]
MNNWIAAAGVFVALLGFVYKVWEKSHRKLKIIKAVYGKNNLTQDIAKNLNRKIKNNKLHVQLTNEIGGDPAKGERKIARIKYWYDGKRHKVEYVELEIIDLP